MSGAKYLEFFGGLLQTTAQVVLLEKQPFLIKYGFQMKGIDRRERAPNGCHEGLMLRVHGLGP